MPYETHELSDQRDAQRHHRVLTLAALFAAVTFAFSACEDRDPGRSAAINESTTTTTDAFPSIEARGVPEEQSRKAAEIALADPRLTSFFRSHVVSSVLVAPVARGDIASTEEHVVPATSTEDVYVDAVITPAFSDLEFGLGFSDGEFGGGVCGIAPTEDGALTGLAWIVSLTGDPATRIRALSPTWADGAGDCFDRQS
jgi:hypothetical protein